MPRIIEKTSYTQKEIASAISNAVVQAAHPNSLKFIPHERLRCLREYAQAACEVMLEHTEETLPDDRPLLRPEELVLILLSGALFVQSVKVMNNMNVNNLELGKLLFEKDVKK